jgi:hypothetical protein
VEKSTDSIAPCVWQSLSLNVDDGVVEQGESWEESMQVISPLPGMIRGMQSKNLRADG